ncbi:MAG: hypothetical protein WC045_02415, partial [Patescibacteria group bacterium]
MKRSLKNPLLTGALGLSLATLIGCGGGGTSPTGNPAVVTPAPVPSGTAQTTDPQGNVVTEQTVGSRNTSSFCATGTQISVEIAAIGFEGTEPAVNGCATFQIPAVLLNTPREASEVGFFAGLWDRVTGRSAAAAGLTATVKGKDDSGAIVETKTVELPPTKAPEKVANNQDPKILSFTSNQSKIELSGPAMTATVKLTWSANDPDGTLKEYSVSDGQGNTVVTTGDTLDVTFTSTGKKKLFLTALDTQGGYDTQALTIEVTNAPEAGPAKGSITTTKNRFKSGEVIQLSLKRDRKTNRFRFKNSGNLAADGLPNTNDDGSVFISGINLGSDLYAVKYPIGLIPETSTGLQGEALEKEVFIVGQCPVPQITQLPAQVTTATVKLTGRVWDDCELVIKKNGIIISSGAVRNASALADPTTADYTDLSVSVALDPGQNSFSIASSNENGTTTPVETSTSYFVEGGGTAVVPSSSIEINTPKNENLGIPFTDKMSGSVTIGVAIGPDCHDLSGFLIDQTTGGGATGSIGFANMGSCFGGTVSIPTGLTPGHTYAVVVVANSTTGSQTTTGTSFTVESAAKSDPDNKVQVDNGYPSSNSTLTITLPAITDGSCASALPLYSSDGDNKDTNGCDETVITKK